MNTKEYWERRQKLEKQFFIHLEELKKDIINHFDDLENFDEIVDVIFKNNFPEYYEVYEE